jgi:hypothetical protein
VATRKSAPRKKTTSRNKSESKCEVEFVGGKYNGKTLCIVFPSPKYLVLSMGTELYERQDPDIVLDATYRYTDNWDTYREWLKEQAFI